MIKLLILSMISFLEVREYKTSSFTWMFTMILAALTLSSHALPIFTPAAHNFEVTDTLIPEEEYPERLAKNYNQNVINLEQYPTMYNDEEVTLNGQRPYRQTSPLKISKTKRKRMNRRKRKNIQFHEKALMDVLEVLAIEKALNELKEPSFNYDLGKRSSSQHPFSDQIFNKLNDKAYVPSQEYVGYPRYPSFSAMRQSQVFQHAPSEQRWLDVPVKKSTIEMFPGLPKLRNRLVQIRTALDRAALRNKGELGESFES